MSVRALGTQLLPIPSVSLSVDLSVQKVYCGIMVILDPGAITGGEWGRLSDGSLDGGPVLDAQTQNGDEPVGEYSFLGQSCLSSADSC